MTPDRDLELGLHRVLDTVDVPETIPPDVVQRARRGRGVKVAACAAAVAGLLGFWTVAGDWFLSSVTIQPADRHTIPFAPLPVEARSQIEGLTGFPLAPSQFPDCTTELVEVRPHNLDDAADVTLRPKAGVQCGLDWTTDGVWMGADGERYEPRAARPLLEGAPADSRLLLMGDAGASHWAGVAGPACRLEAPISYFITLGDEQVEVATIENPQCSSRRRERTQPFTYRMGGVETPAGSLKAELETPPRTTQDRLSFELKLTNDTDDTVVLGRCPFFEATFETSEAKRHLRSYLNCPAAPDAVEPGDELRFPIELPLEGITGSGRITFVLRDERRPLQRITSATIEVRP